VLQVGASAVVEKVPEAQDAQVRSEIALPVTATYCPELQAFHATHSVAAFESWSQLPVGHVSFAADAPAQYVPVSHPAHTGGAALVPAAVCTVPAGHESAGRHDD
jgi:hypothetical protein